MLENREISLVDCIKSITGKTVGLKGADYVLVETHEKVSKSILDEATLAHIGIMETKDSLAYGIIKRDPSKDKRIMEFCLSIPSEA